MVAVAPLFVRFVPKRTVQYRFSVRFRLRDQPFGQPLDPVQFDPGVFSVLDGHVKPRQYSRRGKIGVRFDSIRECIETKNGRIVPSTRHFGPGGAQVQELEQNLDTRFRRGAAAVAVVFSSSFVPFLQQLTPRQFVLVSYARESLENARNDIFPTLLLATGAGVVVVIVVVVVRRPVNDAEQRLNQPQVGSTNLLSIIPRETTGVIDDLNQ
mmetsp:Transcript_35292/g.43199  ORF Transcript_35292/g.43199 Transcript_35292/m.43199 type:complete len:211 (+) Transcript_35292:227-859(+)